MMSDRRRQGIPRIKQREIDLSKDEVGIAKIIELKLCPLLHKGSWGDISEAGGKFPNEDGGNPWQKNNKCSGLTVSQGFRNLRKRAISLPVSKFRSKKKRK